MGEDDEIDSYGVDHSGFTTRDEVVYQTVRNDRENELIQNYNKRGITDNYPQYGRNFWGSSPENNYGFGSSNITDAINNHPAMNTSPVPITTAQSELNDYQRGVNRFEQTNATGSFMSGVNSGYGGLSCNNNITDTTGSNFGSSSSFGANSAFCTMSSPWNTSTTSRYNSYSSSLNNSPGLSVYNYAGYNAYSQPQSDVWAKQRQRAVENDLLMDGMDVLYGMNRTINGMTFGGLDWLGNKLGIDTQMNEYLQLKNPQERELTQNAGQLAQIGGGALTGKVLNDVANHGYNQFARWNGRRILKKQLQRGNNFNDIYMGKVDKDKLNALNSVRRSEGAEFIPSRKVNIPKDRVQHIYEERIIGDGYTPKEAADTIYDAMFNPKSKIQASRYKTLQKFDSPTPSRAIVGKIRDGDSIFIKTGYRK